MLPDDVHHPFQKKLDQTAMLDVAIFFPQISFKWGSSAIECCITIIILHNYLLQSLPFLTLHGSIYFIPGVPDEGQDSSTTWWMVNWKIGLSKKGLGGQCIS